MKNIITIFVFLVLINPVCAKENFEISFIGMDPSDKTIHLLSDFKMNSLIIERDVWKIKSYTKIGISTKAV